MNGPCEHCGNDDKSQWLGKCLYKGPYPSRRAFTLSTFDPPCAFDAYDEGQRDIMQASNRAVAVAIIIAVGLIAVMFFCFT